MGETLFVGALAGGTVVAAIAWYWREWELKGIDSQLNQLLDYIRERGL